MTYIEQWVQEQARLFQPANIHWCDGSEKETRRFLSDTSVFQPLSASWPNAFLHRSHPLDTARLENRTFVCASTKEMAGPTNNWMELMVAKELLTSLSRGAMQGRAMYVIPFFMGDPRSPLAMPCAQITDSVYVAANMNIMTRMGKQALEAMGQRSDFIKGIHAILDLDPEKKYIVHFPEEDLVWSVGSGYGGNALLGKKCIALRLASWRARSDGWLAEHMALFGVEDPSGEITYMAAAMPSACGKTNLAMLKSVLPGYRVWTLGDDICWMYPGHDGRLYAINPETGVFGVAKGTSEQTNFAIMEGLKRSSSSPTIFTNTALDTATNEPWWEGLTPAPPANLLDWQGKVWDQKAGKAAAHPNARFTLSCRHLPTLSPEYDNPGGVPVSAIIFGCRRTKVIPLVRQARTWAEGVFFGASLRSETTAAAEGARGEVRNDPMAMLPFCGYNMGDYFRHWLKMGEQLRNPPKIFAVNWFRKNAANQFVWPGFGHNIHALKWIMERAKGELEVRDTPMGLLPLASDLGMEQDDPAARTLLGFNQEDWDKEMAAVRAWFKTIDPAMDSIP